MRSDRSIAEQGHSTNLVGLPSGLLASADFNRHPQPLHIHGTREAHGGLFTKLTQTETPAEAGAVFQDYMSLVFGFEEEQRLRTRESKPRRFRSSYLALLQDWGFDSNNPQAAVLKGWAESRFGVLPTFHKAPLTTFNSRDWLQYLMEKMNSRYHNNCIFLQLDVLFEFCQWALRRFGGAAGPYRLLYRGVDTLEEWKPIGPRSEARILTRFNNIVSFTDNRALAGEFGAYLLEAEVPVVKLLFFNDLLPQHSLRGEAEYIAVGGTYQVKATR